MLLKNLTIGLAFLFISSTLIQAQSSDSTEIHDEIIMKRIMVIGKPTWLEKATGSADFISKTKLEKFNHNDVNRVLRSVSGVNIQEEDGFGLRPNIGLRGTGVERSSKVTLMEDGVLIAPAPYAAPAAYYFPSVHRMSSIEVRKGSSQIKYGPYTTGGAINFISSRIPYQFTGKAEIGAGQFNSQRLSASLGNTIGNFGYILESYIQRNDGFKELDNNGLTGYDVKDFLGKLMYKTDSDAKVFQKVTAKIGYYDEISEETYLGLTEEDFRVSPFRRYASSQNDVMVADQLQFSLQHFAQVSSTIDLTTTIYRNEVKRNWYKLDKVNGVGISSILDLPENYNTEYQITAGANSGDDALSLKANNREYYSRGIQTILGSSFKTNSFDHELEMGFRYHEDGMDRFQWVDGYSMQDGTMILTSEGTPGTESNRIESAYATALFIQDNITFSKWKVTPGLRFENIILKRNDFGNNDPDRTESDLTTKRNTLSVLIPGIGFNYELNNSTNLFGGVHRGFAPPSPGASEGTEEESSINYELGVRFENEDAQKVELVAFYNAYSNLLGTDLAAGGGGGSTDQFNAGEVQVFGVELGMGANMASTDSDLQIPIHVNYTFTSAEFQNSFESEYDPWGTVATGDEMPYLPKHQFNVGVDAIYKNLSVNISGSGTSKMRTIAGSEDIDLVPNTDSYFLIDISASYQITSTTQFVFDVRNLTDKTYLVSRRPAGLRPGLPRMVQAGIKLTF